jgi:hypothetical protein
MQRIGIAVLASIVISLAVSAQQPSTPAPGMPAPGQVTPPRGLKPGQDPLKGTAILRGYVVAAETGSPVRRAMVRAFATTGGMGGGGVTSTDADGRFELRDMPAGSYNISVSKAGYVTMQYGQRRPNQGGGTLLEVRDGQLVEKIAFSLPRGGVITGRVTDEYGDPIAGAQVNALQYRFMGGGRRLTPAGGGSTDDLGNFRIFGLAPGEYFVSGVMRSPMMMGGPGMTTTTTEGYAPTYFPGTPSPAQGQRVTVRAAQETTNVSFALSVTRLVSISGRVMTAASEPVVQAMVRLAPADRSEMGMMMMGGGFTRADGSFQIGGVTPGSYSVMVMPRDFNNASSVEFGQARVTVGTDNIENVLIVTSRGATLRGSIVTEDQQLLPVRPQQVNAFARPVEPEVMMPMGGGPARVHEDWTFEMTGLAERRIIGASVAEGGDWLVKAVYHNGIDITDAGLEFTPGQDVDGVQIVFTNRRTEVTGLITDDRGKPSLDATVIAFSQDVRRWTSASRYVRTARSTQDGRYTLRGLPPDDYFIAIVRDIEPGQWQDPEYLETLRDSALRISIAEGESRAQDLKLPR